ncbi:hypothetical protein [Streptomyces sp. NPDC058249]|uniref:hypothetical protein n=1 Tax=Streptomyces sp. NPDC058249 TaxID=3346403 RepID=UPI0036E780E7
MRLFRALRATAPAVLALLGLLGAPALTGCAMTPKATKTTTDERRALALPTTERGKDDLIDTAQRVLVERCLARQGLTLRHPPDKRLSDKRTSDERPSGKPSSDERSASAEADRRLQAALFGRGRPELSVTLPTGYTVTAHTDGCLAAAQRELYGDQGRWFRARVVVNNLGAEVQHRMKRDPDYRAATARWTRCATPAHGTRPVRPDPAVSARCARRSGLAGLRARLEPALLAQVRADRRDQLTTYERLRTRALHRAAALYAERTVPENPEKGSTSS